jgi:hypothetical protein
MFAAGFEYANQTLFQYGYEGYVFGQQTHLALDGRKDNPADFSVEKFFFRR